MLYMTRQQFIDAVEAGIKQNELHEEASSRHRLSDAETMMLRHVARTENEIARGTFVTLVPGEDRECGCPLTTAGIDMSIRRLGTFWVRFDLYTADLLGTDETYIQIVG